jgi:glutamate-1-semialdehyde 2,1-aminomutase
MDKKLKIVAIVQGRLNSNRLPNKVIEKINSKSVTEIIYERLKCSKFINDIIFAVPRNETKYSSYLKKKKIRFYLGNENNVLKRYFDCAKKNSADIIIRITADCPLVDSQIIDNMIKIFKKNKNLDLLTNYSPPSYPDGLDVSIFNFKTLKKTFLSAKTIFDQEHVVPFMLKSKLIKKKNIKCKLDLKHLRWTLDEKEDLEVLREIFKNFKTNTFSWKKVLGLVKNNPDIFKKNSSISRDEGSTLLTGQKIWKRAKKIIPGGNMLLSKRPEFYLENKWPTYFSKAKDCFIWDLDGNKFLDMSMMGVGTNILGYGNSYVDKKVNEIVEKGNMSTLNCKEEVLLAEKLLELHPWAGMCKFTRSGGEANAVAIRIARAYTKKQKVLVCGYHGWHDWYLAANLQKDGLEKHLLKGISAVGVPNELANTIYTFEYNDFKNFMKILNSDDKIGIVKMEVTRNYLPKSNFLKKIRDICNKKNIILIFDECTSGFRGAMGGLHKIFNVTPDVAIFGKALGNGYAINAIIGKKSIMEKCNETFISSTFWTERIGPTAALATLKEFEKNKSWEVITNKGNFIRKRWLQIAKKNNLKIKILGIPAISSFIFKSKNNLKYRTLVTQELLKVNILATNTIYLCIKHHKKYINKYLKNLNKVFKLINKCEKKKLNINDILENDTSKSFFGRLN